MYRLRTAIESAVYQSNDDGVAIIDQIAEILIQKSLNGDCEAIALVLQILQDDN